MLLPSTIIRLDIALIKVSILLTVKEIAKKIIKIDIVKLFSFKSKAKKARSGITFGLSDTATSPVNPIIKITGIIIKKDIIKLVFKTLIFLAA